MDSIVLAFIQEMAALALYVELEVEKKMLPRLIYAPNPLYEHLKLASDARQRRMDAAKDKARRELERRS
jgi:hypothetical protein